MAMTALAALAALAAMIPSAVPAAASVSPGPAVTANHGAMNSAMRPNTPPDWYCSNNIGDPKWFGIGAGQNGNSNMWVDASGYGDPAKLQIWPGNGGDNQQWCFWQTTYNGQRAFFIEAFYNGNAMCIDVPGWNFRAGVQLQAYRCTLGDNEKWFLCKRFDDPNYSIEPVVPAALSLWMDVWGGTDNNYAAGHAIQLWGGTGQDNQRFWLHTSPGSNFERWPDATPGC